MSTLTHPGPAESHRSDKPRAALRLASQRKTYITFTGMLYFLVLGLPNFLVQVMLIVVFKVLQMPMFKVLIHVFKVMIYVFKVLLPNFLV